MKKLNPLALAAVLVLAGASAGALAQARNPFIVQLAGEPAATYKGTVAGYAATAPTAGARFNARTPAALAYRSYLDNLQLSVAASVPGARVSVRYNTVFNGFAAQLTAAEVAALRANPNVIEVHPDLPRKLETISTPAFLGLSAAGGLWSQQDGSGRAIKGEDIVIGIVDSGVWPENPAYADRVDANGKPVFTGGTLAYGPPPASWSGSCMAGEGFSPAQHCNNKLIGAQFFNSVFVAQQGSNKHWTEFYSPRDSVAGATGHGGHGSHTSSTAGGNDGNDATLSGPLPVPLGPASGMAPRARLAMYKVCYTYIDPGATDGTGSSNSCYTGDSVAAIDKAVADGVNVINYSISGSQTSVNDPVEQAFLRAASAGVFVAASAGNSGPAQAVAHVSPWLTTVAASTHSRAFVSSTTLGNSASYNGASTAPYAVPQTPLIRAEDAGLAGADPTQLSLCYSNPAVLDPAKVAGKIVICTRGVTARVDKSLAVANAGGVGMILADNGSGLVADVHSVPTVHVSQADGNAVKAYAQGNPGATAAIAKFTQGTQPAPTMAGFSSRGPNAGDANMLKPDLTAPGVDIIAAVTADLTQAQRNQVAAGTLVPPAGYASYQGTSMSSPHVAGLAALLKQAHPNWTPQAIKSALMTTATLTLNDGLSGTQNGQLPWSQGAGHVAPNKAFDPGLVYDNDANDFIRYQCNANRSAVVPASLCTTVGTLDQTYNYNLPSITVGAVPGTVTVTRRVTNVSNSPSTYTASVSVPGFAWAVTPGSLSLQPGETKSFTVKFTTNGAADGVWSYGALTWTDGTHVVRSPVTLRTGKLIVAPSEITGTTASGTRLITVRTGFAGRMGSFKGGWKPVTMGPTVTQSTAQLSSAQFLADCRAGVDTAAMKVYPVSVAAGTMVARFELRQVDTNSASNDHDLLVLNSANNAVGSSGNAGSDEAVQLVNPAAGNYRVCVLAWDGPTASTHQLSSWVVTPADVGGTLNVLLPGNAVVGGTATVGVSWKGLALGGRYLGAFTLTDTAAAPQSTTVLRVNPGGTVPAQSVQGTTK
ncbi:MAG: S8 family serine peptidase [Rubrivivax sp.]|nr:S8 family serine peptidase [Rubrivivax sp.]